MMRRLGAMFLAAALAASPAALAQEEAPAEGGEMPVAGDDLDEAELQLVRPPNRDPRDGTPLISSKLYPMQFRFEGTAMFDFTYANKYTQHWGGHAALGLHVFDWLAVELYGGYMLGDETNITDTVRDLGKNPSQLKPNGDPNLCAELQTADGRTLRCEPELPDLWQTTWFAGGNVQWAPLYGKLSFVSELDLSFQLYGMLGGGVEGIQKRLNDASFDSGPGFRPVVNYGLGLRIIPWKWVAVRAELKNFTGMNPGVPEKNSQGQDVCEEGYTLQVGPATECYRDFSNNSMIQLGVSFLL